MFLLGHFDSTKGWVWKVFVLFCFLIDGLLNYMMILMFLESTCAHLVLVKNSG